MVNIQKALAVNDFATLKRLGHGFKGTVATFGMDELSALFFEMEKAAKKIIKKLS
jgi:HPt (histidine-containing phosphotransfer) domain-containing protein